jgi:hypothetical protein
MWDNRIKIFWCKALFFHGFYCKNEYEILGISTVLFVFHCDGINLNETLIEGRCTSYVSSPPPPHTLYFQIAFSV